MRKNNQYFIKYILVGGFNSFISYSIIFFLMYFGMIAEISNFIGYFFGILMSYYVNKRFTFSSSEGHQKTFMKFIGSMSIAYIVNLFLLIILIRFLNFNEYLSQLLSGIAYTLVGFILSKKWVFKSK